MTVHDELDLTTLLGEIQRGDAEAEARLFDRVYRELRQIASGLMGNERRDHTLQPTALVNEAAMRLIGDGSLGSLENRRHFFGAAAQTMRRILVDHARSRKTKKRGGDRARVPLSEQLPAEPVSSDLDEVMLDDALRELESLKPRQAQIVVLRRYGGLANDEIAELLGVKLRTVEADFSTAKAWLFGEIRDRSCGQASGFRM